MQRLILVYNPRSSKFGQVKKDVLDKVRDLKGWTIGKYEVKPIGLDKNADDLAKILRDGDTLVSAGGDGTSAIALNAAMKFGGKIKFGILGYGNFNDLAKTFKVKKFEEILEKKPVKVWPLETIVDGKHWRYSIGYVTMGLFAEATEVFDDKKTRKKLQGGKKTPVFSWKVLAKWYFKNKNTKVFMPKFLLNGVEMSEKTTDYVAMNGKSMAGVMRGRDWYLKKQVFQSATAKLGSFWRLFGLMAKSILYKVPGKDTRGDVLEFVEPGEVEVQAEGEYVKFKNVKKIEVRKAEKCLEIVKI